MNPTSKSLRTSAALRIAYETADRVVEFHSYRDADCLPGILANIVCAKLKYNGYATANVGGVKTLYIIRK
jgi:hypothetical protein